MPGRGESDQHALRVNRPEHSALFLPSDGELRRVPRSPNRQRSASFMERFEDRALFYDCFWHANGQSVLLIGPPPVNLEKQYQAAKYTALPGNVPLHANAHLWRSTQVIQLTGVPSGTAAIRVEIAGVDETLSIQPNHSDELAGRRLMFTMNKNNELDWIREWARYHAVSHSVDAIVLFDNGSTLYAPEELAETLSGVPGISNVMICDWPHKFGALDRGVLMHRFWAHFLQNSAMTTVIRRFGAAAQGLLNCDIDELVAPVEDGTIFDFVDRSPDGLVHLDGTWVTSARDAGTGDGSSHFHFQHLLRDPVRIASPGKWVLDAKRDWVQNLDIMASWHRVRNAPAHVEKNQPHGRFWHFQGINSNWKSARRRQVSPNPLWHRQDKHLSETRDGYFRKIGKG